MNEKANGGRDTQMKRAKKNKGKWREHSGPALSIEDLFITVSTHQSNSINPAPARVVLTPQSAEACLKHGVNPEVLRIRDLDSFWEPGLEPDMQKMRHEAYSQRRHELMNICRQERKRLINAEKRASMRVNGHSNVELTADQVMEAKNHSAMIEEEQRIMEKRMMRQEKEIEQLLEWENQQRKVQEEARLKMEKEAAREDARRREIKARQRAIAEEVRLKELKKQAMEEAEQKHLAAIARANHDREVKLKEEKKQVGQLAQREARKREEEHQQKQKDYHLQTQRILEEQAYRVQKRMEDMAAAEQKRQEKLNKQQEEAQRRQKEQRRLVEERINKNLEMAAEAEEKRKKDYYEKKAHSEAMRMAAEEELAKQRGLEAREHYLMEKRRKLVLQSAREDERRRREGARERIQQEEEHLQQLRMERERHNYILKEKNDLKKQLKQENVERIARMQEYKRLETLRRISEADHRIGKMMTKKEEILEQRRRAAREFRIQRDRIARVMEEATRNKGRASTMLQLALSSSSKSSGSSKSRKHGSARGRLLEKDHLRSVQGLRSSSAGPMRAFKSEGEVLGAPPEAPSMEERMRQQNVKQLPQPFMSPYEQPVITF